MAKIYSNVEELVGATPLIQLTRLAKTLDLNAGQVIDRIGVKLGLTFPCGNELDKLATLGSLRKKPIPTLNGDVNDII